MSGVEHCDSKITPRLGLATRIGQVGVGPVRAEWGRVGYKDKWGPWAGSGRVGRLGLSGVGEGLGMHWED